MEGESIIAEQSEVLTNGEVANIVEGTEPEEAVLDSDKVEFEVPEKFKGKSAEEIAKAYVELEKMKSNQPPEEDAEEYEDEVENEDGEISEDEAAYNHYEAEFEANGGLSEESYTELAEAGYSRAEVDAEIADHVLDKEFTEYKQEKQLNSVLEPLGGGTDKFKEVAAWANEVKSVEDINAFNESLAVATPVAQQAMLRGLYSEYDNSNQEMETVLHAGSRQTLPGKGYKTQEEFFKDVGSPEYKNNAAYRSAVEKKMSLSGDLF